MKNNENFKQLLENNGISNDNVSVNYVANNTNKYIDHSLTISLLQPPLHMIQNEFINEKLIEYVSDFYKGKFTLGSSGLVVSVTNYGSINIQVSILNPKYKINTTNSYFVPISVEKKSRTVVAESTHASRQSSMVFGNNRGLANKKVITMKYSWSNKKIQVMS